MKPYTNNPSKLVITQIGGWKALLVLVPVALIVFVLAGLMFAFLASLLIGGSLLVAVRLWWLKRKFANQAGPQTLDGDYVVLERHSESIEHHSAPYREPEN